MVKHLLKLHVIQILYIGLKAFFENQSLIYYQNYLGQKLSVDATVELYSPMVFTRSQQTPSTFGLSSFSIMDAARALLNLRGSSVTLAPVVLNSTNGTVTQTPSQTRFWTSYTNWYHSFLSEATDESPSASIADRRSVATSRWVTFASKQLRCSESDVRGWLRKADQKALLAASA